jgi:hypothetical protein
LTTLSDGGWSEVTAHTSAVRAAIVLRGSLVLAIRKWVFCLSL